MASRERTKRPTRTNNPLGEDLHADRFASAKRELQERDGEADESGFLIPSRTTQKILRTARRQLEQDEADHGDYAHDHDENEEDGEDQGLQELLSTAAGTHYEGTMVDDDSGEVIELEYDDVESVTSEVPSESGMGGDGATAAAAAGEGLYDIDEEEARLLQKFQPTSRVQKRTLGDMIMEKIRQHEDGAGHTGHGHSHGHSHAHGHGCGCGAPHDENDEDLDEGGRTRIDPRVAKVYTAIGSVLKRYTSGKIPKAFKILPNVKNWEDLLMLTKPDQWSPHATYQATRIFAANLNERMAQRFYAAVLLPVVHERLVEEKKLHPALYMAVRKALFKPVAFFKGFLLPLASDEECTLREALVIASILQKSHLPPVPTAVSIVKIAQQPFSGPCSVFLRVLIDKKMALPYQAIDALVAYFHRFTRSHSSDEPLPVLWHQTLLSFCQRYKNDLTAAQLELLGQVCSTHFHYMITPETRREITAALRQRKQ